MSRRTRLDVELFRGDVPAFAAAEQAEGKGLALPRGSQSGTLEKHGRIGRGADAGHGAIVGMEHCIDLFSRLQVNVDYFSQ